MDQYQKFACSSQVSHKVLDKDRQTYEKYIFEQVFNDVKRLGDSREHEKFEQFESDEKLICARFNLRLLLLRVSSEAIKHFVEKDRYACQEVKDEISKHVGSNVFSRNA